MTASTGPRVGHLVLTVRDIGASRSTSPTTSAFSSTDG
jgi:hypothetical protein